MKRLFSALRAVLTVVLAGVLLLTSTACGSFTQAKAASSGPDVPGQAQPYEGGMNNFRDVDPNRLDTKGADAQAKALKDRVERNINQKRADSVDQYVENYRTGTPLGERTRRVGEDLGRGANEIKDDLQDLGDRGSNKLQQSADRAPNEIGRTFDQAKGNAKNSARELTRDAQEIGDSVGKGAKGIGNQAGKSADDAASSAKRAIDKAA